MSEETIRGRVKADVSGYKRGMDDAGRATEDFRRKAETSARGLTTLDAVLGGLGRSLPLVSGGVAGVALAAVGLARSAASTAAEMGRMAEAVGVSAEAMSRYQYAARIVGVESNALKGGLAALRGAIEEDSAALRAMGVAARDAAGQQRPMADVLAEVADRFKGYTQGASEAALGQAVFGKSFDDLQPLLERGAEGLRELTDEADTFGTVVDDEAAAAARQFEEDLKRLQGILPGLAMELAGPVVSALGDVIEEFNAARRAGMSFLEMMSGTLINGMADPTKSLQDKIAERRAEIEEIRGGSWSKNSLVEVLNPDGSVAQLEKEIAYLENLVRLEQRAAEAAGERGEAATGAGRAAADAAAAALEAEKAAERERERAVRERARAAAAAARESQRAADQAERNAAALDDLIEKIDREALIEAEKAVRAYHDAWATHLGALDGQARALEDQVELFGLTEAQIAAVTLRRAEERLEMARMSGGVSADYLAALEQEVALRRQIAGAAGTLEARQANAEAVEEAGREWERTAQEIEGAIYDAIVSGGEDAGEVLERTFKALVLRPVFQPIAQTGAQIVTSALGLGGQPGQGGASGGVLGGAQTALSGINLASSALGVGAMAGVTSIAQAGLGGWLSASGSLIGTGTLGGVGAGLGMIAGPVGLALAAASLLGAFDKKPSDKTAWASVDPTNGRTFDVGGMTGKKDPGQEAKDNTASLAALMGSFAKLVGVTDTITAMTGGRDGMRLRINREEGTHGFLTPLGSVANGGNSMNFGSGDDAIKLMLEDIIDEGTLPLETIERWKAMREDTRGVSRDASELISVLGLITSGYSDAAIERGNLVQAEGELLDAAVTRVEAIEKALSGTTLPGDELAKTVSDLVKGFEHLGFTMPSSKEALNGLIAGLDTTTEEGRAAYQAAMGLAEGYLMLGATQEEMYNALLTDEQRLSNAQKELSDAFGLLNLEVPKNRDGLLELLGTFDRTTESGASLYAQVLSLGASFLDAAAAAKQLEDQRTESYRKLLSDEERLALDGKSLTAEFEKLGYTLPKSKDQLRGWIDALNNSADAAGSEKERLQKIAEAYDNALGGSTGFEKFIDYAGQTEEEARNTANGLIALIEATLDYQEALDKSTEAARNAREEAMRAVSVGSIIAPRAAAYEMLRTPEELKAIQANELVRTTDSLTRAFTALGFELPDTLLSLRNLVDAQYAPGGLSANNLKTALLDLVPAYVEMMSLRDQVFGTDSGNGNDAIERARDNLRAAYEDQRASLEKTRDAMRSFVDSLKQYRTSLLMGDKSPLNPLEKYRLALAEFETTSALAATGDEDALGRLKSVSDALLDASRQMYASGDAYSADFDKVLSALDAAGIAATIEETLAQQSLDQLEIQVGALIDINASVLSVEQAIKELAGAFASGSTSGPYAQIADTYRTSLGRDPDSAGMAYWMTQHDKGTSVADIQTSIAGSAEAQLRSAYKEVLGRDPDSAGAAYWLTEIQKGLSMDQLEQSLAYGAAPQDKAKALKWLQENGLPGFANGGLHSGGLRVVGERGVEIEATGPARYWNFNQTQQMLGGSPELLAEVRALRAEVAALRQQQASEHREAVAANYDANDRNATRIAEATERIDRQRRTAERFA